MLGMEGAKICLRDFFLIICNRVLGRYILYPFTPYLQPPPTAVGIPAVVLLHEFLETLRQTGGWKKEIIRE